MSIRTFTGTDPLLPVGRDVVNRLADLIVLGATNLQPGQLVQVDSGLGREQLTRAIASSAYRHGALYVSVDYFDSFIRNARITEGSDKALETVPDWVRARTLAFGEERAAWINLSGVSEPDLLGQLDPVRSAADRANSLPESLEVIENRTSNWAVVPGPSLGWAQFVYPDLAPELAYRRLWDAMSHICRLDEEDPVAAWRERQRELGETAEALTSLRLDSLHFTGPGTDLTVGLLPTSRWRTATFETVDGISHMANMPSEEVFTVPDPNRADGFVTATKPLIISGTRVEGLRVTFQDGVATEITADAGSDALNTLVARDEGARRLGEVALVDGSGRIGPLDTIFFDTLLDENAASHIALGKGFASSVGPEDAARVNSSDIHIDFMIGSENVDVTGIDAGGKRRPILRGGAWGAL